MHYFHVESATFDKQTLALALARECSEVRTEAPEPNHYCSHTARRSRSMRSAGRWSAAEQRAAQGQWPAPCPRWWPRRATGCPQPPPEVSNGMLWMQNANIDVFEQWCGKDRERIGFTIQLISAGILVQESAHGSSIDAPCWNSPRHRDQGCCSHLGAHLHPDVFAFGLRDASPGVEWGTCRLSERTQTGFRQSPAYCSIDTCPTVLHVPSGHPKRNNWNAAEWHICKTVV